MMTVNILPLLVPGHGPSYGLLKNIQDQYEIYGFCKLKKS
jgi:hypothetical protein